jgi:hypothetical protein
MEITPAGVVDGSCGCSTEAAAPRLGAMNTDPASLVKLS